MIEDDFGNLNPVTDILYAESDHRPTQVSGFLFVELHSNASSKNIDETSRTILSMRMALATCEVDRTPTVERLTLPKTRIRG